jgi:protein-disulfide isomerase
MPKSEKKTPTPRTTTKTAAVEPVIPAETTSPMNTQSIISRLSQQFNLLAILVIAIFLFQAYTFYQLHQIRKTVQAGGLPAAAQESPLSEEKLISYAKELKLDEKKFEQCLTKGEAKDFVAKDLAEGQGLNVQGTPGFFINGKFLAGAFPFEVFKEIIDKELDGTATGACSDYSEAVQQFCSDPAQLAFNPEPQDVSIGNAPVQGPKDAKVTIVEYSDFECPFCQRAFGTIEQVMDTYKNDVKVAYKQMPLANLHPNATRAAEASVCAQKQGKFWEYHDKIFQVQLEGAQQ